MGTLFGALFGYMLRGTTGSEGFQQMVESAQAVRTSPEFENLLRAAKSHAGFMIKDLSERLSQHADQVADVLTGDAPAAANAEPADWEAWPPPSGPKGRPSEELHWPRG